MDRRAWWAEKPLSSFSSLSALASSKGTCPEAFTGLLFAVASFYTYPLKTKACKRELVNPKSYRRNGISGFRKEEKEQLKSVSKYKRQG